MTEFTDWRDVKAKARALDPTWDGSERAERRRQMREELLLASVTGVRPAEIRKQLGL